MIICIWVSLLVLFLLLFLFQVIVVLLGMNFGQIFFFDGKVLFGMLFQQFVNIYEVDDFMDVNGYWCLFDNCLCILFVISYFVYISQYQLFGVYYGVEIFVLVLFVDFDFEFYVGSVNGFGNLIVSLFIL